MLGGEAKAHAPDGAGEENDPGEGYGFVTARWRNIDTRLTHVDLVAFLDLLGFGNAYNEVYVAIGGSGLSTGVAVVTFYSMTDAEAFKSLVDGQTGRVFGNASQPCTVEIESAGCADAIGLGAAQPKDADAQEVILTSLLSYLRKAQEAGLESEPRKPAPAPAVSPAAANRWNKVAAPPGQHLQVSPDRGFQIPNGRGLRCQHAGMDPKPGDWPEGVATAMIRNIACRFSKEDVAEELDILGFKGQYEGVRVPKKPMMQSNLGYAFVSFVSPEVAKRCRSVCHGRTFGQSYTTKICEVVPAHIQGVTTALPRGGRKRTTNKATTMLEQSPVKESLPKRDDSTTVFWLSV